MMHHRAVLSRRAVLGVLGLGAAGALLARATGVTFWGRKEFAKSADDLVALFGESREQAIQVGRTYVEARGAAQDAAGLLTDVNRALGESFGAPVTEAARGGSSGLQRQLQKCVEAEFRRGDTVSIDGWIFARTEARVYGLVYLASIHRTR